jgi:hypothetical protein
VAVSIIGGGNPEYLEKTTTCRKSLANTFLTPLSKYFNYIVAVIFIDVGIRSTHRKPPTYRKSMTNVITYSCNEYPSRDSNSQL